MALLKTRRGSENQVNLSIGKYIITFHLFSVLCQRRYCCWKYRKWGNHLKNRYYYTKVVENSRITFSISSYWTLLFSRKENFNFFEVALPAVLCNGAAGCIMNVRVSGLKYCQYHTGHLLAFRKTVIKVLKQVVKFVET